MARAVVTVAAQGWTVYLGFNPTHMSLEVLLILQKTVQASSPGTLGQRAQHSPSAAILELSPVTSAAGPLVVDPQLVTSARPCPPAVLDCKHLPEHAISGFSAADSP